jgi:hypothetical protein
MLRRGTIAGVVLLTCAAMVGCGNSTHKSAAETAFEEAEIIPVGRSLFLRLPPKSQSPQQRRLLAKVTGGKWLGNGLLVPADRATVDCRAHLFTGESCHARPAVPRDEGGIGGPSPGQEPIGGVPLE